MPNPAGVPALRAVTWMAIDMSHGPGLGPGERDRCGDRRLRTCGLSLDRGGRADSDDTERAREEKDEESAVGGR